MFAVKDFAPDTHIIHIGTMGEYGTPNIDIEEGWLDIEHKGRRDRFLFPRQASSIYHTSKIMDTDLFWFGIRTWKLRMTDLMQGPVYGIETEESRVDERLRPYFNYDEIFGTVIKEADVSLVESCSSCSPGTHSARRIRRTRRTFCTTVDRGEQGGLMKAQVGRGPGLTTGNMLCDVRLHSLLAVRFDRMYS